MSTRILIQRSHSHRGRLLGAFSCAMSLLLACERIDLGDNTLAAGTYDLGPNWCASTLAPPIYPSATRKLALFAFEDLITNRLEVAYPDTTLSLASTNCTLTVTRTLARNYDGAFSLRHDRRHRWDPEGCHLRLRFDGIDYQVGRDTTNAFLDSTDLSEEMTYAVVPHENGWALTTVDREDYHELWKAHGCGPTDRLFQTITQLP